MSSVASWSYTAKATIWPAMPRDGWDGSSSFGAPVVVDCDYRSEAKLMRDAKGEEFVSALSVFTEYAAGKPGDMLALGDHSASALPAATARPVRVVGRDADTFERVADDFTVVTS
jgi:hypothetical protein